MRLRNIITGSLLIITMPAWGQGVITTVAGVDWVHPEGPLPALQSPLGFILHIVADPAGNLFLADHVNRIVFRMRLDGTVTQYAGHGISGPESGDGGPATRAGIASLGALALDSAGNLYIGGSGVIRKVTPGGIISRFAGTGASGFSGDNGDARQARFAMVNALCFDKAGNLYLGDNGNRVRRISPSGIITSIAGNGQAASTGDGGPAITAALNGPSALLVDSDENLLIAELNGHRIRRVNLQGIITTFSAQSDGFNPRFLAQDGAGNVYVVDAQGLRRMDRQGVVTKFHDDSNVYGAALEPSGTFVVWDLNAARLKRLNASGATSAIIAGNGQYRFTGDGGPAIAANFYPGGASSAMAVGGTGAIFTGATIDARVRRISSQGIVETIGGTGQAGFVDPPAPGTPGTRIPMAVTALAADEAGNVYVSELNRGRIYKLDSQGRTTQIAEPGFMFGMALDRGGNLYGTVRANSHSVVKVAPNGAVTHVAGGVQAAFTGDGGPATSALFNNPRGIAVDLAGNIYVADTNNNRVRRIQTTGRIDTYASMESPTSLALDPSGRLYILQRSLVRRVEPDGSITTVAGGGPSYRDGVPPLSTSLDGPLAIAVDNSGSLYVLESSGKIRKVLLSPPSVTVAPSSLTFEGFSGSAPTAEKQMIIQASIPDLDFVITTPETTWLRVSPPDGSTPRIVSVRADPAGLVPGTHTGTILVRTSNGIPPEQRISVQFVVGPEVPPSLSVGRTNLTFTYPRTANLSLQPVRIANAGSGTLEVAVTTTGGGWLSASPSRASLTPDRPAVITVSADPRGFPPGTYNGVVLFNRHELRVVMTISSKEQAVQLSQSGLSYIAVAQGGLVPPQDFGVLNIGNGLMRWTATASTLTGGNWLSVSTPQGTTEAGVQTVPVVQVRVDQSTLAEGRHYGQIRVDAADAANSPQVLTVFLDVLSPSSNPGSIVQPSELVFTYSGDGLPGSQDLLVYNLVSSPVTFRSRQKAELRLGPTDGVVQPARAKRIIVQPATFRTGATLSTDVSLQFSDGTVRTVPVSIVDGTRGAGFSATSTRQREADGCLPARLMPAIVTLGQAATAPTGWPAAMALDVRDDCGAPLIQGSVVASFSNGDSPIALESLKDGRWHGTWQNRGGGGSNVVVVTFEAANAADTLHGVRQVQVGVTAAVSPPLITEAGVVSLASPVSFVPTGPGGLISIYGEQLTDGLTEFSAAPPLRDRLGDAQVILAGRALPLLATTPGQINAMVPYDIEPNTSHQLLVRRGTSYSRPVPVNVGPAQPAFFQRPDGRAIAVAFRGSQQFEAIPANPVRAGDVVVFYCAGLGAVTPALRAGEAPLSITNTAGQVRITIGGVEIPIAFAGLAPGFAGLYQVNAVIPEGVPAGLAQPAIIEVAGQSSPRATIPVQ